MEWLKTIGIFFKGLFATINNQFRWTLRLKHHEVRLPVEEAQAEADVEEVKDRAEVKDAKRDLRKLKKLDKVEKKTDKHKEKRD